MQIHNEQHVVRGSTVHVRQPENIQHTNCPTQTIWVHILQGKLCNMLQQSYPVVVLTTHKTGGVTLNVAHHPASAMLCLHLDSVTKMMGYSWELLRLLHPVGRVVTLIKCKVQQSLRPQTIFTRTLQSGQHIFWTLYIRL